jgi:hypothetical protein
MRHRGRYHMCWLTRTKGEPELHYCPPVDGLWAPGYIRCVAPAGKDDHDVHPQGTRLRQICGCSQNMRSMHKYDIAYSGVDWRHRLSEVAR